MILNTKCCLSVRVVRNPRGPPHPDAELACLPASPAIPFARWLALPSQQRPGDGGDFLRRKGLVTAT